MTRALLLPVCLAAIASSLPACGSVAPVDAAPDDSGSDVATTYPDAGSEAAPIVDSGTSPSDVGSDASTPPSDTSSSGEDATPPPPMRLPCVPRAGLATDLPLNTDGELEGQIVSLVPPGTSKCPSDTDHLHLQIAVGSKRYDVAVTVDSTTGGAPLAVFTKDVPAGPLPPNGWGAAHLDFPTDLAAHSGDFTPLAKADLLARLEKELATASTVSIHGLSYTDGTGLHDVHRNGHDHDGAIFVHQGATDHVIALRFSTDTF
jgi:hypothetical protein